MKHIKTSIGGTLQSKFVIYHNNKIMAGEWNEFSSFVDAEEYLLDNFHKSARPYQIVEFKTLTMVYEYK